MHKRSQVVASPAANFVGQAQGQYNQCYNGTGSGDDIINACHRTQTVSLPGVKCDWRDLWFMVDRVPDACVGALSQLDATSKYNGQRNDALNWLLLLIALPVCDNFFDVLVSACKVVETSSRGIDGAGLRMPAFFEPNWVVHTSVKAYNVSGALSSTVQCILNHGNTAYMG